MKLKLIVAVLAISSMAFAQRGGRPAGVGGGSGNGAGIGAGMGSGMSGSRGSGIGDHGRPSDPGSSRQAGADSRKTPSDILSQNTKLSGNLEKLLPSGSTAQQACIGFKNLGECVAAIHVAHNLDIPFDSLKAKVTGDNSESLGNAIKDLKPSVDAKSEAKKATQQAKADLKQSS